MERKQFNTRVDSKILKDLKRLAVEQEKPINHLLEEAIKDLLIKYEHEGQ